MEKIIIDSNDRDIVQRADVEAASLMNLITFMINHNMDITNERFQQYEDRYKTAFLAFEQAKSMIEAKYLTGLQAKSWKLSYANCELIYEK